MTSSRSWGAVLGGVSVVGSLVGLAFGPSYGVSVPGLADPSGTHVPILTVSHNHLQNQRGHNVQLQGLNRSGSEYACAQGWGIFDGPVDDASITAMTTWQPDIVRLPLNEDCWLGINGVPAQYGGAAYRSALKAFVHRLHRHGLLVDLELHLSAPGDELALGQQVMADEDHSVTFWRQVAKTFRDDPGVLFELFNEPHDISWDCWLNGCRTDDGWQTAGMQEMLDAVRGTGARNIVLAGGLGWSSDLSQWLAHEPQDPVHQLVAAFHTYNFSGCNTQSCWDSTVADVAETVPVITTEFGENDCAGGYVTPYMKWADQHHISYLAWTWDTWDCGGGPALITSYDGSPTGYGQAVLDHFTSR